MTGAKENPQQLATAGGLNTNKGTLKETDGIDILTSALMSQAITYTEFPDVNARSKREISSTWGEFIGVVRDAALHPTKDACTLINGATFAEAMSKRGSLRHRENMGRVFFIEGDYDAEAVSPADAAQRLRNAGLEALIYTTARHTPDAPRWRVFCPLSQACAPEDRAEHVATLNGALGGILAGESFVLSQSYYIGRVAGVLYECLHVPGGCIDEDLLTSAVYPRGASSRTASNDDDLNSLPEDVPADSLADLAAAVRALPAEYSDGYGTCVEVLQHLKHLAWCGHAATAEGLAREFCKRSAKFTDAWFSRKWERQLHPWRGHYKTIFRLAQAAGWANPRKRPEAAAVIATMLGQAPEVVRATWATLAASMSPEDAEDLKDAVHRMTGIKLRALGKALKEAIAERKRTRTAEAAGGRLILTYQPHDSARQSRQVEARILRDAPAAALFVYAGRPSRMIDAELTYSHRIDTADDRPDPMPLIDAYTDVSMRALAEEHVVFQTDVLSGPSNIAIPPITISMLRELPSPDVPRVTGTSGHPVALPNGTVLYENGLHPPTGLFVHGVHLKSMRPYSQAEGAAAWQRLTAEMLAGFEFASTLSRHIALAGLFTAVQRRLLDCAPGLMILAPIQSSGKITLARRIHAVLTGRDMPVLTLTIGDDAEIEKRLLAVLMHSPAMVTFDNVPDGMTVNCGGALNSALTSPVFEGRLLGSTQTLQVPTNTFFALTGNNLQPGKDEVSRWLTTVLAPAHARPQERTFRHPDVMGHALSIRDQVLRDVVGIVAGYLSSGDRLDLPIGTRFEQWEKMVRRPIVWVGGEDVAQSFTINGQESEHDQALRILLLNLQAHFGDRRFDARDVVDLASGCTFTADDASHHRVSDALESLAARDTKSPKSVGRALRACTDRAVEVCGQTIRLRQRINSDKVNSYMVEACGV